MTRGRVDKGTRGREGESEAAALYEERAGYGRQYGDDDVDPLLEGLFIQSHDIQNFLRVRHRVIQGQSEKPVVWM